MASARKYVNIVTRPQIFRVGKSIPVDSTDHVARVGRLGPSGEAPQTSSFLACALTPAAQRARAIGGAVAGERYGRPSSEEACGCIEGLALYAGASAGAPASNRRTPQWAKGRPTGSVNRSNIGPIDRIDFLPWGGHGFLPVGYYGRSRRGAFSMRRRRGGCCANNAEELQSGGMMRAGVRHVVCCSLFGTISRPRGPMDLAMTDN